MSGRELDSDTQATEGMLGASARRALVYVGVVALALFLWKIVDAFLVIFIGVLLAVLFRGLAVRLSDSSPLSTGWSLAAVATATLVVLAAAAYFLGPRITDQFAQLSATLPETMDQLRQQVQETTWGQYLLDEVPLAGGVNRAGGDIFSSVTGMASRTMTFFTNAVLILFAALFFAIDPALYKRGLVLLVPKRHEARVDEALDVSGRALWKWLMGKLLAMAFVGTFVTVGLLLLGVPLALVLGLIAGLMDFVPFVGPIASAVPAILLGLTVGPAQALYVALVYLAAQQIEGNMITPLVQQKEVSLPPALILFAVIAAGLLLGLLGIIVATPLVVVAVGLVKMLYVEVALGKEVSVPGRSADR